MWARATFWLGVDLGDLEVRRRKERCRGADDSAPFFLRAWPPGLSAAAAPRPPAPSTRPGSGDVVGWGGTRPPRPPTHTYTHARVHTYLRKGETEARQREDPRQGHVGRGRGVRLRFCAPLDPAPRRPDA